MLKVVQLPPAYATQDIPSALRALADRIESGDTPTPHQAVYVLDIGEGAIEVGLMGQSPSPGTEAYFLLACDQKKIMGGIE